MPKDRYSSAKRAPVAAPTPAPRKQHTPTDQDALDALEFARRGRPDSEIGYSDDAPKLTDEQLAEFEPASFRIIAP